MRKLTTVAVILLASVLCSTSFAMTYSVEDVPNPRSLGLWVSDEAQIIDALDEDEINRQIAAIHREQGIEIAVVTVDDVDTGTPKEFATELFNHWGIGDAGSDNGLLVLMVVDRRRLEMETGYGTEVVLTDGWLKSMQGQEMVPHFKTGDYGTGLKNGVRESIERLRQYPDGIPAGSEMTYTYETGTGGSDGSSPWLLLLGLLPVLGIGAGVWRWSWKRDRTCPECNEMMEMIPEDEDDEKLSKPRQLEERLGSVDYQFWYCTEHEYSRLLRVNKWFSGYSKCRQCNYKTMTVSTRTVRSATYSSTGLQEIIEDCRNCSHHDVRHRTLPRKTRSSSSSSSGFSGGSSGGSFGGGSSGGGGAGSSW